MLAQSLKLLSIAAVVGISVGATQSAGNAFAHKIPTFAATVFAAAYPYLSSEPANLLLLGSGLLVIRRLIARKVHA